MLRLINCLRFKQKQKILVIIINNIVMVANITMFTIFIHELDSYESWYNIGVLLTGES
jgi:hypothetical protein